MDRADTLDEKELIRLSKSGDKSAFSKLVKLHENTVASVALNMLQEYNDAEDIGQKVFVKLYENIHAFREEASLKTYITKMTINYSLNELKRRKSFWTRFKGIDLKDDTEINENTDDKELVNKALTFLDDKFRAVVVLRAIQGYDTRQTAEILGIPTGTVLSRYKRGIEKMKEIIVKKLGYERE